VAATATTSQHNPAIISLQKQLKYEESPSSALKLKLEKNAQIDSHDCRRRLEMLPSSSKYQSTTSSSSSSSSSKHHHNHHHHHRDHKNRDYRASSNTNSSSKHRTAPTITNDPYYHHRNANTGLQHHHYVNAIPSPNRAPHSSRYINQSDLCTKIISGNYMPIGGSSKATSKELTGSFNSSNSSSLSSSDTVQAQNHKHHNHTSACCGVEGSSRQSAIDSSMRCTLRRGRPNTPKTGLNVDYRIRKSSVPNTPECTHLAASRVNHTISSDDYKHISGEELKKNLTSYIQAAASSSKSWQHTENKFLKLFGSLYYF